MRTISSSTAAAIGADGTTPRYLLSIGYDPVIRLSSRETVTWDGNTWTGSTGGFDVVSLDTSSGGGQRATVKLPNHDASYAALVLGDGIRDITADIYMLYGSDPFSSYDAEHIFSGKIDGVPSIDDYVTLNLASSGGMTSRTPRVRLATFLGDNLPTPGTRIQWNGDVLVLREQI